MLDNWTKEEVRLIHFSREAYALIRTMTAYEFSEWKQKGFSHEFLAKRNA